MVMFLHFLVSTIGWYSLMLIEFDGILIPVQLLNWILVLLYFAVFCNCFFSSNLHAINWNHFFFFFFFMSQFSLDTSSSLVFLLPSCDYICPNHHYLCQVFEVLDQEVLEKAQCEGLASCYCIQQGPQYLWVEILQHRWEWGWRGRLKILFSVLRHSPLGGVVAVESRLSMFFVNLLLVV